MASWWRDVAQQLGITGSGSWQRRVAQALQATEGNGPWSKHIAEKGVSTVPADGAIVTNNEVAPVRNTADSATLTTGTAKVTGDPGAFGGVKLPGTATILTDQQSSVLVNQYDDTGSAAAAVHVTGNALTLVLANVTSRIAFQGTPVQVSAGSKTVPATVALTGGAWAPFPLTNSTDAIVQHGDAIEVENQAESQNVVGSVVVAAGVVSAKLPANAALVGNNVGLQVPVTGTFVDTITPQVNASGVVTGFTLS
jgi:hypothetical protein